MSSFQQIGRPRGLAIALAGVLSLAFSGLALAQTDAAVEAATVQIDAQSDQWILEHLAKWLRANGCTVSRERQQDFQDGVLELVLENLQVPPELHAELIPVVDDRMERAADAWFAAGQTYEDLGLFMDADEETLKAEPC